MLVTCIPLRKMAVVVDDESVVLIDTSNCKYMKLDLITPKEYAHDMYVDFIIQNSWWVDDLRSFTDLWTFGEV